MCNGQHSSLPGKVKVELNFSRGRLSLWGRVFILFYFLKEKKSKEIEIKKIN
jgi:hypothetical protein